MAILTPEEQAKRAANIGNGLGMFVMLIPFFGDFISILMAFKHLGLVISRSKNILPDILRVVIYECLFLAAFIMPFVWFQHDLRNEQIYVFMVIPAKIVICLKWFRDIDTRLELKANNRDFQDLADAAKKALKHDRII